ENVQDASHSRTPFMLFVLWAKGPFPEEERALLHSGISRAADRGREAQFPRVRHQTRDGTSAPGGGSGLWLATEDVQDHLFVLVDWRLAEVVVMPYSPDHKKRTRQRILKTAARLFNQKGFSEASIEDIMRAAGLSHGGFYRHFKGKDELYA